MSTETPVESCSLAKAQIEDCDDTAESSSSSSENDHPLQQIDSSDETRELPNYGETTAYNSGLLAIAREGTGRWALTFVILLSICVATNSFLLLFQNYSVHVIKNSNSTAMNNMTSPTAPVIRTYSSEQVCASQPMVSMTNMGMNESSAIDEMSPQPFVWHTMMELEISILTNFIHSALLMAAGVVVYARGDTVWLFFVRHVAFFWTLISIAYCFSWVLTDSTGGDNMVQYLALSIFGAFSALVWNRYGCAYQSIQYQSIVRGSTLSSRIDTKLPQRILYVSCILIQYMVVVFYTITTAQYVQLQEQCGDIVQHHDIRGLHDIPDHNESSGMGRSTIMESFVMAYSEAAHSAFLLALVQLAAAYPTTIECAIGAILVAAWRILLGALSIWHVMDTSSMASVRVTYSLFYTTAEIVLMLPILFSALYLYHVSRQHSSVSSLFGCLRTRRFNHVAQVDWVCDTVETEDDKDSVPMATIAVNPSKSQICPEHVETGQCCRESLKETTDGLILTSASDEATISQFDCLTTSQIASSNQFTTRQRWGAYLLSLGSAFLLAEMTIESILLQSQSFIGSNAKHDIYKWGLHACVMCAFCMVMSVDILPSFYKEYARPILFVACPTGTFVALRQTSVLLESSDDMDSWSWLVVILFGVRAVCGIVQTLGVALLHCIQSPYGTSDRFPTSSDDGKNKAVLLQIARNKASIAVYRMFLPILILYIVVAVAAGNCSTPMLSPTIPVDAANVATCNAVSGMDLMLMQNFPGLGLFFHFGLVLVLFVYDGIQASPPTYKPSLYLAFLWAGNLALFLFTDLIWDVIQTQWYTSDTLSGIDIFRRILLLLLSMSSGYLAGCLVRLWNLRVTRR